MFARLNIQAREDMIRYHGTPAAFSLWPSTDGESDCRSSSSAPATPSPLSVFTPFWTRPCNLETLPAPVTISYVDYYPAPSEDDNDYLGYEDEDDHSFAKVEETHPVKKVLNRMAAFWKKLFA